MSSPVNIICMRWGKRYPVEYVNNLHAGVKRHLSRPFRFVCVTDQPEGLDEGVEAVPFPPNPGITAWKWPNVFVKIELTRDGFANLEGPTLFLDLDVLIMDSLDELFDYKPGKNVIIHNWIERRKELFRKRPDVGNSSVFRFEAGKSEYIHEMLMREIDKVTDQRYYATEQAFLTKAMGERYWWPEAWIQSFKRNLRPIFPLNLICAPKPPKKGTKILVFHGKPDPHEASQGCKGKRAHHTVLPAPWVDEIWKKK